MSRRQKQSPSQYAEAVHCTRDGNKVRMMDGQVKVFKSFRLAKHFMRTGKEAK
jgi:hypothetical protein